MIVRTVWCSGFVLAIAPGRAGRFQKESPAGATGLFVSRRATIGVGESDSDECHLQSNGPAISAQRQPTATG